jgi:hypothetical protein
MVLPTSSHSLLSAAVRLAATSAAPACILDGRAAYLFANDPWRALEAERGTPRSEAIVGAAFVEHLDCDDVRQVWSEALRDVLSGAALSRSITSEHDTPTLARLTSTRVWPIASGGQGVAGLVLVRTVVRERPISDLHAVSNGAASLASRVHSGGTNLAA